MIVTTLFTQINGAYRGTDDDAPASGTPDFTLWLATANRKISEWATDDKSTWGSNFYYSEPSEPGTVATTATTALTGTSTNFTDYRVGDRITVSGETVRTIATIPSATSLTVTVAFSSTTTSATFTHKSIIATGVQSYNLHRNFNYPSDKTLVSTTAQNYEYVLGEPQQRERFQNEVYISGMNPQVITFQTAIASTDPIVGGTLIVPGYFLPPDLTSTSDVVPVPDPYWLVYAVASELSFNDQSYSDKSPDLNAKANNLYSQMVSKNRRGTSENPRTVPTSVSRITNTEVESL